MAKATSDTPSVIQRIAPLRRPSGLGMTSRSSAPTSGTSQESVSIPTPNFQIPTPTVPNRSRWALGIGRWELTGLSPQVVPQDYDHTNEHRACIREYRTGLQAAQHARAGGDQRAGAVDRAVNHPHVEAAPQPFPRGHDDRLDHGGVVNLVDVVLVEQQAVNSGELT